MASEEIIAKFGGDVSPLQQKIAEAKGGIASFANESQSSFIKATNGGREFKKMIGDIAEQSPIMGGLLRTALNPLAGLFGGIALGAGYLFNKLEETNKALSEMGRAAAQPLYTIASLLRSARHEAAKFNEEYFNWRNKPQKDQDLEFMEEKLSLLKLQAAEAAKLSPDKAKAIEKASAQTQFDIQARELDRTAKKVGTSGRDADDAARAYEIALKDPTISKAKALIKADEETIASIKKRIEKKQDELDSVVTGQGMWMAATKQSRKDTEEKLNAEIKEMTLDVKMAQKRIEKNGDVIDRETENRKAIADKLAEAKGIHDEYKSQFNALSKTLESTRQHLSIITGVANPEHTAELSPFQKGIAGREADRKFGIDMWRYNLEKTEQDWRRANGLSWHDVTKPVNANQNGDAVKSDIAKLNDLFSNIVTTDGMKVTFELKDD